MSPESQGITGMVVLPAIAFVWAIFSLFARRRTHTGFAWILFAAPTVALVLGAVVTAMPQAEYDFDTMVELYLYRLGRTANLSMLHRPYQFVVENQIVRALAPLGMAAHNVRISLTILGIMAGFFLLVRFRRTFFLSSRLEYPVLAACAFFYTSAGRYLIDSWNDHALLAPFFLGGLVCILRFKSRPVLSAVAGSVVFLAHSLLHSAEPWLWAVGIVALPFARGSFTGTHRRALVAWGLFMGLFSTAIFFLHPSSGSAYEFVQPHFQRTLAQRVQPYAHVFGRGGIVPLPGAQLVPLLVVVCVSLIGFAVARRRLHDILFGLLFCETVLFPVFYESSNPERYWMVGVLWSLIGSRALRELSVRSRSRRIASGTVSGTSDTMSVVGRAMPLFIAVVFLTTFVFGVVLAEQQCRHETSYNRLGRELSQFPRTGTLIAVNSHPFFFWQAYYFPGSVRYVERTENADDVVNALAGGDVYLNAGAVERISPERRAGADPVFSRGNDPGLTIYRLR